MAFVKIENGIVLNKQPNAAAIADVAVSASGLSINVVGIGVMAASGTQARLEQYGTAINAILARLRTREMIAV